MKIIFILSSPRSGSKSLSYSLDKLQDVDSYHVPTRVDDYTCSRYLKDISKMNSIRRGLIKKSQKIKHHYSENAVCLRYHLNDVISEYPKCNIIHLVRDGRDFIRSGMSRVWYRKYSQSERIKKIAELWVNNQREIRKNIPKKNYGGVVRMEDLVKNGLGDFIRDYLKLKFDNNIEMLDIHKTKKYEIEHWNKWTIEQKEIVEKVAGEELKFYGYKW
jgi:hypothetical protein